MSVRIGPLPGIRLAAIGHTWPGPGLENEDAARLLGCDPRAAERARELGVERRHWLSADESPTDLAARACRDALGRAGWRAQDVDLVITATSTPERITRSQAALLLDALSLEASAHDVRAGGAAGIVAWIDATQWLANGVERALVVAVETCSRFLDPADPAALIYGDGAVVLALERDARSSTGLLRARMATRPLEGRPFTVPGPLPPREGQSYRFQSPDRTYREGLDREWDAALEEWSVETGFPFPLAAYPITSPRLESVAARWAPDDPGLAAARACLRERGCLGAAGALAAVEQLFHGGSECTTFATVAVGGGGHRAGLLWRHS